MPRFKCPKCHNIFFSYERHPECPKCKKRDVTTNRMSNDDDLPEERSMFSPSIIESDNEGSCLVGGSDESFSGGGGDFGGGGVSDSF